ncbi:glycosyltransferase family 4 protein [Oryzifoliimicrobium ureilyticus]|uniref:glycosyltransferase family 4 protein n=1 Tax=Oryzifoliimicrobium ureilyticus TaxID=3113724 RepID=UPI003075F81F
MTRVLHLIHTPRHSGAEVLVRNLCLNDVEKGDVCSIASFAPLQPDFAPEAELLVKAGVKLNFPEDALSKLGRIIHYRKIILDFKPDVIIAHSVLPSLYGRLALASLVGKRRFLSVLHAASNDDYGAPLFERLERILRRYIDVVVAVSREGALNYERRFGSEIPIVIIPNGIDFSRFGRSEKSAARDKLGISQTAKVILQVGRIAPVKQQSFTIEALRAQLSEGSLHLFLAGIFEDGSYLEVLEKQIKMWKLEEQVSLLGGRSDIPDLLSAADVYVMPSIAEAQPIAIIEALAAKLPVVASRIPALEVYDGWQGVDLVDIGDMSSFSIAVMRHLSEERLYDRDLSAFSIGQTAEKYRGCYNAHGRQP